MGKNIAFIDLETTGTDFVADRIVQVAVAIMDPDTGAPYQVKEALINPGRPIPNEATEVHGINDQMVAGRPTFAAIAKSLFVFLEGSDVGGFNVINFDVPFLAEEFARCSIDWPAPGTLFFDPYQIFATKERRDLTGAVRFYLDRPHEGAHGALADVLASVEVLKAQMNKYPDLDELPKVAAFCQGTEKRLDLAGKIILNAQGVAVYSFGKSKGESVIENPGFAMWMLKPEQNFPENTKKVVRKLLRWGEPAKKLF